MSLSMESAAMRIARCIGWEKGAWALRRLHCPVPPDALVLEVGSGGNPYSRSNVLLDAFEATRERHWAPLVCDRPTVLGFAEDLPFRDGAFDFVIASHVLEHSSDPARFLSELQRVARAGYIETPDAFMERVNPYRDHRSEVTARGGRLLIRKKASWQADRELVDLYERRAKKWIAGELIPAHPFEFHVRHFWEGRIDFEVVNPEVKADWPSADTDCEEPAAPSRAGVRGYLVELSRAVLSQRTRNKNIDMTSLLRCSACRGVALRRDSEAVVCSVCATVHPVRSGGLIVMQSSRPL